MPAAQAGAVRNPYRQWIGALIRADIFGYVNAGNPRRAAEMAYQDAVLSHRRNGIYGEMWAAALVAGAFTETDTRRLVASSLSHIPPKSWLHQELSCVIGQFDEGLSWEEVIGGVHARYQGMSWVHTINNAGIICAGVLWGGGDYSSTIGLTVAGGLDTDSNGATAGSVAGAMAGSVTAIPAHWHEPLHNLLRSAVFGFDKALISELAARTSLVARQLAH